MSKMITQEVSGNFSKAPSRKVETGTFGCRALNFSFESYFNKTKNILKLSIKMKTKLQYFRRRNPVLSIVSFLRLLSIP